MGIDSSIPLRVNAFQTQQVDPLEAFGKAAYLRNVLGQERLRDMQVNKLQRDQATEDALRQSIVFGPNGEVDRGATMTRMARVSPMEAMKQRHSWIMEDISTGKAKAEAYKADLERRQTLFELQGRVAQAVKQAGYSPQAQAWAKQQFQQMGADANAVKAEPQFWDSLIVTSRSHGEQLAQEKQDIDVKYPTPESKEAAALQARRDERAMQEDKARTAELDFGQQQQNKQDEFISGGGVVVKPYTGDSGEQTLQFEEPPQELSGEGGGLSLSAPASAAPYSSLASAAPPMSLGGALGVEHPTMVGDDRVIPAQSLRADALRNPLDTASWEKIRGKPPEGTEIDPETGAYVPLSRKALEAHLAAKKAGAQNTTVNMGKVEQSARIESNKDFRDKEYRPTMDSANSARRMNSQMTAQSALAISDKTGWGTEAKAAAARVLGAMGIKDAEKYASDAQAFNSIVFEQHWEQLVEQKGPQTEGDATRALKTKAALGNTPQANQFVRDFATANNNLKIAKAKFYNKNYDRAMADGDISKLEREWADKIDNWSIWDDQAMKKWQSVVPSAPGGDGWKIEPVQ